MATIGFRTIWIRIIIAALVVVLTAAGAAAQETAGAPLVTASTSWAAAIAEAAGAEVGRVLAPVELRHPPEYDFRPGDIRHAVEADYIVWAGYEGFMRSLFQAAGIPDERILRVHTNNTPSVLRGVVRDLAEALGTLDRFAAWEEELDEVANELAEGARRAGASGIRAVVHVHYTVFAEWLGYEIVDELGMAEITPSRLTEILAAKPDLIIDNWHMPTGEALRNEVAYVQLHNFPGRGGTRTLLEVLRYNARLLGIIE